MRIRFPGHLLDLDAGTLVRGDEPVHLQPKTFALLTLLVGGPGRLVTHEEVLATLWPDVHVTAGSLSQVVRKLRKAIGDDARSPRYLETVPARGLRWIGGAVVDDAVVPPTVGAGRAAERDEATRFLASDRVVALVGPGGIGKTWLARTLREPTASTCTVALEEAHDPDDVAALCAAATGTAAALDVAGTLDRIGAALADRGELLLVLDGADRVAVGPTVADWLAQAPDLRVIVTARVRVPGLPNVTLGGLDDGRGAALLARLSGRADPDLESLSAALDGHPLALELAAERLRTLSAAEVLARLDQRFTLLRDRMGRGLEAVLQDSFEALDPDDRSALAALAVLHGSLSLPVVEAALPGTFVPDVLQRLADHHWLERLPGERTCVRLSASVRAFAARLGDREQTLAVVAAWVLLGEGVDRDRTLDLIRGLVDDGEALPDAVLADLARMAALALKRQGAVGSALQVVAGVVERGIESRRLDHLHAEFIGMTGRPADALERLDVLLRTAVDVERARLQLSRGVVLRHLGRVPEARTAARDAIDHAGANPVLRATALHALAVTDERVSQELYDEVLAVAERHGERRLAALARFNQAVWLQDRARHAEAVARYGDVLADPATEPLLRITGHRNLATSLSTRGDEAAARQHIDRAIGLARAGGRQRLGASCERVRADIELHAGHLEACERLCRDLMRDAPTQDAFALVQVRLIRGAAAWCAGREEEATGWLDEAVERADRCGAVRSATLGRILRACVDGDDPAARVPAGVDDPELAALMDVARGLHAVRIGRLDLATDLAEGLRSGPAMAYRDVHWALPRLEAKLG